MIACLVSAAAIVAGLAGIVMNIRTNQAIRRMAARTAR